MLYRYLGWDRLRKRVLRALVTDPASDPVARDTIAASLRHLDLETRLPEASADELVDFDAPVAVFLGERDPFFPPEAIRPRIRKRLRTLHHLEVLPGEKHVLSPDAQAAVSERIRTFLTE